jgi:hypothetical protein
MDVFNDPLEPLSNLKNYYFLLNPGDRIITITTLAMPSSYDVLLTSISLKDLKTIETKEKI